MGSLDVIFTVGSLIIGIMLLTGHGDIFMRGGNPQERKKRFDEKKMERASGIAFVLMGVVTGVDCLTESLAAKIIYMVVLIAIFAGLIIYIQKKCRIDK